MFCGGGGGGGGERERDGGGGGERERERDGGGGERGREREIVSIQKNLQKDKIFVKERETYSHHRMRKSPVESCKQCK